MKNCIFCWLTFGFLLLISGCSMDFDYTGQSFAPRAEFAPVTFFQGRQQIPAEGYRIIGRGVLTVAPKVGDCDTMGELREQARKHGADAVCIVDTLIKRTGVLPENQDEFIPPYSPLASSIEVNSKNSTWDAESLEGTKQLSGVTKKRSKRLIRFLFLKKSADLEKELKPKNPLL